MQNIFRNLSNLVVWADPRVKMLYGLSHFNDFWFWLVPQTLLQLKVVSSCWKKLLIACYTCFFVPGAPVLWLIGRKLTIHKQGCIFMKFLRFFLIKRAILMVALLLVANSVFAQPEGWQVFSDPSLLRQAIAADQKSGASHFVVLFVANWSIQSITLKKKLFSVNPRGLPGYSFLVFDVSEQRSDQIKLQNMYGLGSVPAVVVLNKDMRTIPGKRVCGDIWKNNKHFIEWLRSNAAGKVNDGCVLSEPTNFKASVDIKTSQSPDSLLIKLDIPQEIYLPYNRISLKLGSIQIDKDEISSACRLVLKNDPYFGDARVCKGKAEISIDMKNLRRAGCKGRENIILSYSKYNYSGGVLFPPTEKSIRVDCR